ncbi:sensor histidine kinase, partial [Kineococcus indalonis]|uniref:sensor histidine kinase n=1 Tax=Kineococcus indalonis TaxID=2696566 RepID=UPI001411E96B
MALLRAPREARTWRAVLHRLCALALAVPGALVLVLVLVGAVLSVTLLGLPLVAVGLVCARALAGAHRWTARRLLGEVVPAPGPRRRGSALLGLLGDVLTDTTAWRCLGHLLVQVPLAVAGAGLLLALSAGVGSWASDPQVQGAPALVAVLSVVPAAAGGALLVLWCERALTRVDQGLARRLLGPDPAAVDADRLRRTRSEAVEGSAVLLRHLERDLHDGTQARLTAVAMTVDLAREELRGPRAPGRAAELLDVAHATTTEGMAELREIIRGFHPPALAEGLGSALTSLAAGFAEGVETRVELDGVRPSPAIEAIAYFCATELLANAARHAGARRTALTVTAGRRGLRLVVADDGRGGALAGPPSPGGGGTGLAG